MGAGGSNPICTHCSSTKSPLWRRGVHAEILCNACGLYWKHHGSYRPLTLKAAAERKEPRHTDAISAGPGKRESNLRRLKSALGEMVEGSASRRKSKSRDFFGSDFGGAFREGRGNNTGNGGKGSSAGKLNLPSTLFLPCVLTPGRWRGEPVYPPELAPSTGTANVRLVPAEIRESSSSGAPVLAPLDDPLLRSTDQTSEQRHKDKTLKYIMYQGRLLFQGDHVAVRGDDSQIYFAIVHDFWMISSGEKSITLQWLLPKPKYALLIDGPPETIDPAYFVLGPIHTQPEPIETIVDVFFSPQRLRRDLEGPAVNLVPSSSSMSASRSSTPVLRRSGSLDWTESDSAVPGSSGHLSLPLERKLGKIERRTLSDSEVELHRDVSMDQSMDPCSTMTGSRSVSPIESPVNILDDVEMAHILFLVRGTNHLRPQPGLSPDRNSFARLFSQMSTDTNTATEATAVDPSSRDYYFDSYAHFGIHEEMLKDEVRTMAYRNAIYRNRHLFEGKVVLDIGCGTGILSMFAATAGAKLVIGVDMSGIIEQAKVIVAANGLQDRIVLLRGKMEEVQLPVAKVDIIISEWMGYFLLYESMLDTVLYARDRYLVDDGIILPNRATMLLTAIEDAQYKEEKIHFWDNVYGFDMSSIKEWALREPLVDVVEGRAVVGTECAFKTIDIGTVRKEDLAFSVPYAVRITRNDYAHALLAYFTIDFDVAGTTKPVHFGTGPFDKYTHWKQTVFYLPEDYQVAVGDVLQGTLTCTPNAKNHRDLDIAITCERLTADGTALSPLQSLQYHMC